MNELGHLERELHNRSSCIKSCEEYLEWEKQCDKCLKFLQIQYARERQRLRTEKIQLLNDQITRLKNVRNKMHQCFEKNFWWRKLEDNGALSTWEVTASLAYIEPRQFLEDAKSTVFDRICKIMGEHNGVEVSTVFNGEFIVSGNATAKTIKMKNYELISTSELEEWYKKHVIDVALAFLDKSEKSNSGWTLLRVISLTVNMKSLHTGCEGMKISRQIMQTNAVVYISSKDNKCFAWAVVAALYPSRNGSTKISHYPDCTKVLNLSDIKFPMTLDQITKFERLNNLSINVFFQDRTTSITDYYTIYPLRLTDYKKDKHVNLLYISNRRNNPGHFAYIRDLSRLVNAQLSEEKIKKYICDRCLRYFNTEEKLSVHGIDCRETNKSPCLPIVPNDKNKWQNFQNYKRKERVPIVVYADLEAVQEKKNETDTSTLDVYRHHKVFCVGYYVSCTYDQSKTMYKFFRGENCVSWFVTELGDLARRVKEDLTANIPMADLTKEEWDDFHNATSCHMCKKPFSREDTRVRDYCRLTRRYRGPAHSTCSWKYEDSYAIPVIFHNLCEYDAHFIIEDVANLFKGNVELLSLTKEKYISFTKTVEDTKNEKLKGGVKLRFIDSLRFLKTSLRKLASSLDKEKLKILHSEFSDFSKEDFDLLTRKGVFPYEYVDSVERLRETDLPPQKSFYSLLNGEGISNDDYAHAIKVWEKFSVKTSSPFTLGDYSDLYLKTDVLLLADVFENFRNTCIENYELDPVYYNTLSGYTWDAMLKYTGVKLELLTDIDMILFIERGIRGHFSQCSHKYACANNKYIPSYDPSKPSTYLMHFEANNLYGWAMSEPLPHANFRWVEDVANFDVKSISSDSSIGYVLEVDLAYPTNLHDAHADLPFCPTHETFSLSDAPDASKTDEQQVQLLTTLYNKQRYVIHYRNLQQCMNYGVELKKIHRILQFEQSPWLRGFIKCNTDFQAQANNEFEENLYKSMSQAIFRKTVENVRNFTDIRLVTRWQGRYNADVMIAKPNFHSQSVFSENLTAVQLHKLKVYFNKPIYVGMCCLDIFKTRLYEFHYEYMAKKYGNKFKLMYTDTNCLTYLIECKNVYEDMKRDIEKYDTSDYSENNKYGMPRVNKEVSGLMKDQNCGEVMTEFVGLGAKTYAFKVNGKEDTKRLEGIKKNVVNSITFNDYKHCLNDNVKFSMHRLQFMQSYIHSELHNIYTVLERKCPFSSLDGKRYTVPNSYDTLPWGHYKIK